MTNWWFDFAMSSENHTEQISNGIVTSRPYFKIPDTNYDVILVPVLKFSPETLT